MTRTQNTESADGGQIAKRLDELEDRIEQLETENEELRERVDELESRPTVEFRERDGDAVVPSSLVIDELAVGETLYDLVENVDELDDAILDLDETLDRAGLSDVKDAETREEPSSKLLTVVTWSERHAEEHLSPNQQHARAIAKDLADYVTYTPKGYQLDAGDVRTVLAALNGGRPHTETISRVMDFLVRFADEEDVDDVMKDGRRRLYWTEEAVSRYHSAIPGTNHVVCDTGSTESPQTA